MSQSLDILTPVIDERTKSSDIPNEWANWVKRVMFENTSSQNNTICQFLCNNYRIYFKSRELFIPTIIHHINKIAFVPNSSPDNQVLAVDLASLILEWEDMASEEKGVTSGGGDIVMDGVVPDHEEGRSVSESARISSIPLNLRETCISFLIRYICASDHRTIDTELGIRAINILSSLLSEKHWWDVNVKLSYFEKFLANLDSGCREYRILLYQHTRYPLCFLQKQVELVDIGKSDGYSESAREVHPSESSRYSRSINQNSKRDSEGHKIPRICC